MTFQPYLDAWRERRQRAHARDVQAALVARRTAGRLADHLVERFGARRVILCGSLARGTYHVGSDIDLAAEGLAPGELFRAGAELERAAGGQRVDLVPLESASEAYRAELARDGVVLRDARRS